MEETEKKKTSLSKWVIFNLRMMLMKHLHKGSVDECSRQSE